jgi:hypothetical protein
MSTLTALVLATPLFGLSLTPPAPLGPVSGTTAPAALPMASTLALGEGKADAVPDPEEAARGEEAPGAGDDFATQMQRRQDLAKVHKWLGISTWAAMTVTMVLGFIQFHNLYGFGRGRDDNPCVQGDAIFGQQQCTGRSVPHLTSALATTALYGTTMGVSFAMPDPLEIAEQDTEQGRKLRTHKTLRWVHFGGMVAQLALGLLIASRERIGLDRANDFRALKGLASVHLATGLVTYGALTWSGALMVF